MRFVSISPGLKIGMLAEKVRYTNYGDRIVDREGFIVEFNQNDLNAGDEEFAATIWEPQTLRGNQYMVDEVTPLPLIRRLGVYDTDEEALRGNWEGQTVEDETGVYDKKAYVEQFLIRKAVGHPDFRQIIELPQEPPWPNYLAYNGTPEQLLVKLQAEGHDLPRVLAFERQLAERPQLIALLEQAINERVEAEQGMEVIPA